MRNECYNGFCIVQIISFLWFGFDDPDRCNGWGRFFYWLHLVTVGVTDKNSLKSILLQMLRLQLNSLYNAYMSKKNKKV